MATGDWLKRRPHKNPYDVYLCREPAWITELKKFRSSRLVDDRVARAISFIKELEEQARDERYSSQIPVVPPKPKDLIGRLVDWACRVVK